MYISSLKIKNFRGLDIDVKEIDEVSVIIGRNDSGKTNLCQAILKTLDYKCRKIPFKITDSTDSNKEEIIIEICLDVTDLNAEHLGIVGNLVFDEEGKKKIIVKLISSYNEDTDEYEDRLLYGNPKGDYFEQRNGAQTNLDRILSIIYISPVYDIKESETNYFSYVEKSNKQNSIKFSEEIDACLTGLNTAIQNDKIVQTIQSDINDNDGFGELFEDYKFNVNPKIKMDNLYKSLSVIPNRGDKEYEHIGDAKNKLLATILKSKIYDKDKQKIYLVEEPENHLYVLLQKMYLESLLQLKPEQIIFTTHSPFTIDFIKSKQIIKIADRNKIYIFNNQFSKDFEKYGYLINAQIAEMLYYDEVLLVEGGSEKYFYSYLMSTDADFLKKIHDRRIGICDVDGIAFKTAKILLEKLGVKVYIKTDNDIFRNSTKDKRRYAGILRCIGYLTEDEQKDFYDKVNLKEDDFSFDVKLDNNPSVEAKMSEIINYFYKKNILLSPHNVGFELDFLEFLCLCDNEVDDEIIDYLKKAKLKNLHTFITENNYVVNVNEKSKKSILVSFLYE